MIEPKSREGCDAPDARNLEDVAAILRAEIGQSRPCHPQGAEDVGLELGARLGFAYFFYGAEQAVAGVVDDYIEAAYVWAYCATLNFSTSAYRSEILLLVS